MITNLRHVCIQTDNRMRCPKCEFTQGYKQHLSMLRAYYEDALGLNVVYNSEETWKWGEAQVKFSIIKLAVPGQEKTGPYLELVDGPWGSHVAFSVDKWPENVTLAEPVRLDGHEDGVEVRFCMDLAGNMVELVKEDPK